MTYLKDNIVFEPLPTHWRFINLTGKVFGRLTILGYAGIVGNRTGWWCECECGNILKSSGAALTQGFTRSCKCLLRESAIERSTTHGEKSHGSVSPEYISFHGAKNRCQNPFNHKHELYGGRGIEFRFTSFEQFLTELGRKPTPNHSIERKNNSGHYEPGNCKWALPVEQGRNRRTNHDLTVGGETYCVAVWAEIVGIHRGTLFSRIYTGWCDACAVMQPRGGHCVHR